MSVGICHSVVLLENGDIYGWGKKEYAHPAENEATGMVPELVTCIRSSNIAGIACGVSQVTETRKHVTDKLMNSKYMVV